MGNATRTGEAQRLAPVRMQVRSLPAAHRLVLVQTGWRFYVGPILLKTVIMKHIGLFEGIGGFSLAARWMGWETIAWCEWNEFGQKILKHHFPKAQGHGNIKETDFTIYRGQCDIVTGGFPCQPYSAAGKRLGKEDDRHLWPEMCRAIREIQPRWVVGENVSGLLNWNGGMVLNEIKADLEAAGFEVLPPLVLPACAVNAPHRRDRVWIVAYGNNTGGRNGSGINREWPTENKGWNGQPQPEYRQDGSNGYAPDTNGTEPGTNIGTDIGTKGEIWRRNTGNVFGGFSKPGDAPNTDSSRRRESSIQGELRAKEFKQLRGNTRETGQAENGKGQEGGGWEPGGKPIQNWHNFPTQSPVCSRNDGLPGGLDGITFSKWRNESIKAYGNAIVPQVVFEIFKTIGKLDLFIK